MSELTITAIRLGLLVLLWAFVFSVVGVLRGDLYGTRVVTRARRKAAQPRPAPPTARQPPRAGGEPRPVRRGPRNLTVTEGSLRGTTIPLQGDVLIGRNPECTLSLSDDFASGRHARIYRREDGWYADDLGSTNGTFVGDRRIGEAVRLDIGSRIRIGQTVLELRK
jgi:hypothetical protein